MSYALKVLDLSHHNTVSSFQMIADFGIRGVILKATQGAGYVDPTYAKRKRAALDAGLLVGAYHFASAGDPEKQLQHFLDVAEIAEGELGVLDYEADSYNGNMTFDAARDWLASYAQTVGRKPKLYSGNLLKEHIGAKDDFVASHDLWLAQYRRTPQAPAAFKDKVWLWQYCDQKKTNFTDMSSFVSGVSGNLDCNAFAGSNAELAASWAA